MFRDIIPIIDDNAGCTPLPNNPDIQGFLVRLSLFISQMCFATLLVFSRKDIRTIIASLLLQNYSLLIASIVFIRLEKLSPNDIHFAIGAVLSPVFHLLLWDTISDLIKRSRYGLSGQLGSLRHLSRLFMLGIVPIWVVLSGMTWLDASFLGMKDHALRVCAYQSPTIEWALKLLEDGTWMLQFLLLWIGQIWFIYSYLTVFIILYIMVGGPLPRAPSSIRRLLE
ncbi:hypothetical protein FRC16_006370 [Serendipita sp. 398]|nr:hypothetical protein FRC16_006370 [Serendipita sp. 398]